MEVQVEVDDNLYYEDCVYWAEQEQRGGAGAGTSSYYSKSVRLCSYTTAAGLRTGMQRGNSVRIVRPLFG